jgi:hypothetical protein
VGTVREDILSYQKEEMERVVELLPSSCVLELFHYLQDNGARVRSTGKLTWDGTKIVLTAYDGSKNYELKIEMGIQKEKITNWEEKTHCPK